MHVPIKLPRPTHPHRGVLCRDLTILATVALAVVACAAGSPPRPSSSPMAAATTAGPSPTSTLQGTEQACASAAGQPIVLDVLDHEGTDGVGRAIVKLMAEFEAANPGVTIARRTLSPEALVATVRQEIADPDGPDVVQIDPWRATLGTAVQADLLLPLTEYASAYHWDRRWSDGVLAHYRVAEDGSPAERGALYGLPVTGEIVGLFYDHELAEQRPYLPEPTTLEEQVADFAAIKEFGMVPIVLGAADGSALQVYRSLVAAGAPQGWLDDLVYGRAGTTFEAPATIDAAVLLVEMADRGFFIDGYPSIGFDEAVDRFVADEGQFLWADSSIAPTLAGRDGTWMFEAVHPAANGGSDSAGEMGTPWSIRKTSPDASCAAAFLDFLTTDHAMDIVLQAGALPGHGGADASAATDLQRDLALAMAEAVFEDHLGHYIDQAIPDGRERMGRELRALLGKEITPEQFVQDIDDAYRAYRSSLE